MKITVMFSLYLSLLRHLTTERLSDASAQKKCRFFNFSSCENRFFAAWILNSEESIPKEALAYFEIKAVVTPTWHPISRTESVSFTWFITAFL